MVEVQPFFQSFEGVKHETFRALFSCQLQDQGVPFQGFKHLELEIMLRDHGLYFGFVGEDKRRQSCVHDFSGVIKTVTG